MGLQWESISLSINKNACVTHPTQTEHSNHTPIKSVSWKKALKGAWTSQIFPLDSRLDAASTGLLPGRRMKPSTPAAVIHLLCPPRGRRLPDSDRELKYSFNKRRTPAPVWSDFTWMHRPRSKHKPEQVFPRCSLVASPQGGLYSPWQLPVHLSQWTSLTSLKTAAAHTGAMLFAALWNSPWPPGPLEPYLTIKKKAQREIILGINPAAVCQGLTYDSERVP